MPYQGMIAELVNVTGYNDDQIEAYFARPLGPGPFPGVVVIHHMPGWDRWTREVVRRFADAGYVAIAPHLFARSGPGDPDDVAAARPRRGRRPRRPGCRRRRGLDDYLRSLPYLNGKVGVIGFCSGGRHTYLVAGAPRRRRRRGRLLGRRRYRRRPGAAHREAPGGADRPDVADLTARCWASSATTTPTRRPTMSTGPRRR